MMFMFTQHCARCGSHKNCVGSQVFAEVKRRRPRPESIRNIIPMLVVLLKPCKTLGDEIPYHFDQRNKFLHDFHVFYVVLLSGRAWLWVTGLKIDALQLGNTNPQAERCQTCEKP